MFESLKQLKIWAYYMTDKEDRFCLELQLQ